MMPSVFFINLLAFFGNKKINEFLRQFLVLGEGYLHILLFCTLPYVHMFPQGKSANRQEERADFLVSPLSIGDVGMDEVAKTCLVYTNHLCIYDLQCIRRNIPWWIRRNAT